MNGANFTLTIGVDASNWGQSFRTSAEPGSPTLNNPTPSGIADVLRTIAARLDSLEDSAVFGGPIADADGMTTGHYHGNGE